MSYRIHARRLHASKSNLDIVLAEIAHNQITPWVTWEVPHGADGPVDAGHYFETEPEARNDFRHRDARTSS